MAIVSLGPSSGTAAHRFASLDAVRGLAALAVAFFHFYSGNDLSEPFIGVLPAWFNEGVRHYLPRGVEVFFVLSGFVIAYSLRSGLPNIKAAFQFLLRRLIRVAPPYWATLAIALGLRLLSNLLIPGRDIVLPDWERILTNALFVQDFFDHGHIVIVFWTLCQEVQFYLVAACLVSLWSWLERKGWRAALVMENLFILLFGLSLLVQGRFLKIPWLQPTFIGFWYAFALGMLCYWGIARKVSAVPLVICALLVAGFCGLYPRTSVPFTAASVLLILACVHWRSLDCLLANRMLLHLGLISYSFYLIHVPIGGRVANLLLRVGEAPLWNAVILVLSLGASLAAAEALHRLVERPCFLLSQRFRPSFQREMAPPEPVLAVPLETDAVTALPTEAA